MLEAQASTNSVEYAAESYKGACEEYVGPACPILFILPSRGEAIASWQRVAAEAEAAGYLVHLVTRFEPLEATRGGVKDIINGLLAESGAKGGRVDRVALLGSQQSAHYVLRHAVHDDRLEAVVLISPGLELGGIKSLPLIKEYGNRPSMIVSAAGDTYSAAAGRQLSDAAEGYAELREYPGAAKGVQLLDANDAAIDQVLLWLEPIMNPPQSAQNP